MVKTPKTKFMTERIDKLDFIKIRNFCLAKDNSGLGENICKDTSIKVLLSKIYRELLKLNNKKINNPI